MEQNTTKKFHGLEIVMDNIRMEEQLLPKGYTGEDLPYKPLDYYRQYGFKVSSAFPEIYKRCNGIESDKYIPASLYFYYISPYLVNMNLSMAYVDKNMYFRHFPDVRQPKTIFHNMSGRFYTERMTEVSLEEAVKSLVAKDRFIVKPSIESGRGRDVKLVTGGVTIEHILKDYESNYIIQEIVKQHPTMARLNETSLNTIRLYTYRVIGTGEYVLLGSAVRFGGKGAYRDNACTGGGFCKVNDDGSVADEIHNYRRFGWGSLKAEKGIESLVIPNYDKVVETVLSLHKTIPYMDLIGWDIAVDEEGVPTLIELNQYPDCEFIQIFNGPMFGEYTDDLLEHISKHHIEAVTVYKRSFENGPKQYEYNFEVGKAYSI
jgi:hypothetical protein